jgi:hypothetical protein
MLIDLPPGVPFKLLVAQAYTDGISLAGPGPGLVTIVLGRELARKRMINIKMPTEFTSHPLFQKALQQLQICSTYSKFCIH